MGYHRGLTWHPGLVSVVPDGLGQLGELSGAPSRCLGPGALVLRGEVGEAGLV